MPARVAEPTPPAHKNPDGTIAPPGGPLSDDERDCSAAHNHCMRGNGWMATGFSGPGDIMSPGTAVFPFDGHWYAYTGEQADNTIYRTKPATAAEIQSARIVWVLVDVHNDSGDVKSRLPNSEKDALTTRRWQMLAGIQSVDAKAGTFVSDRTTYSIGAARVAIEAKSAD